MQHTEPMQPLMLGTHGLYRVRVSSALSQWHYRNIIKDEDMTYCLLWSGCLGNVVGKRASSPRWRKHVLILTWQTSPWKSFAQPKRLYFRIIWTDEPSNCTSVGCQVLTTVTGQTWICVLVSFLMTSGPCKRLKMEGRAQRAVTQHWSRYKDAAAFRDAKNTEKKKKEDIKEGTGKRDSLD